MPQPQPQPKPLPQPNETRNGGLPATAEYFCA